jgi:glycerophosphoryl diester phosphodiesterase
MAENSLSGIKACAAHGIRMVEIDLMESRDGELFLLHDESLDRTTTGRGLLSAHPAAEISRYTLRNSGERIPRFAEALVLARELGIFLMLDVKRAQLAGVWREVAAAGMRFLDASARDEGRHHYNDFILSRRPRILVSDYPTLVKAAIEQDEP